MRMDHVVLWVKDPLNSLDFYRQIVGLSPLLVDEYRSGKMPFLSVRICEDSIIDLMPEAIASDVDTLHGWPGSCGHPVNHVCLAMTPEEYHAMLQRVREHGVPILAIMEHNSGARGDCRQAFYFSDPDGNVIEARYY